MDTNLYKYIKEASEIISYLNLSLGTKYKENNKGTLILINKRIDEGYTVDDFKSVIDKKVKTWRNTKFEQYLNPQTLFGDKFEVYLNQNIIKEEKSNKGYVDYREPRKLRFNNFKGRDYDYDDLEKKLLGWE
ncbi:conserved phage C-terminal domain-containing protein [Clostridium tertium]|uniref:conserved phage C-terminal domain-containing protein n=1 Tax=Clostridium tertium TaxID=1559 RepID=UPI002FE477F0